jgi:hypothetical protein
VSFADIAAAQIMDYEDKAQWFLDMCQKVRPASSVFLHIIMPMSCRHYRCSICMYLLNCVRRHILHLFVANF